MTLSSLRSPCRSAGAGESRHAVREPRAHRVELGQRAAPRRLPLLAHAPELTREVPVRAPVALQAHRGDVDGSQGHQQIDQRLAHPPAVRMALQGGGKRRADAVTVDPLHQVERRAEHAGVLAQRERPGHRHARSAVRERRQHPVLAHHVEGAPRQLAARRPAEHDLPVGAGDEVRQARLPLAEPRDRERALELRKPGGEEGGDRPGVDRHLLRPPVSRPLPLAQHELLDLAGRGLGQLAELDGVRALEVGQMLAAEGDDLLGRCAARPA